MPEDHEAIGAVPQRARAPIWSWAHWDRTIIPCPRDSPDLDPELSLIEYLSHETELVGSNAYGGVSRAVLKLSAGVMRMQIEELESKDDKNRDFVYQSVDSGEQIWQGALDWLGKLGDGWGKDVFAMQVKVQQPYEGHGRMLGYSGLLLRATGDDQTFERIGVFILDEASLGIFDSIARDIITLV